MDGDSEFPWPEREDRARARVHALVASVVRHHELDELRLEWETPRAEGWEAAVVDGAALRLTVTAIGSESWSREIWGSDWSCAWEEELAQVADQLEDWVCETRFAWGQQRRAVIPD